MIRKWRGWGMMFIAAVAIPSVAFAERACVGTPHTVHTISSNKNATCVLSKLYETEHFCLTDGKGADVSGDSFEVTPAKPAGFSMIFDSSADFNMEYALTCVTEDGESKQSPKIIFTIGANGAADPADSVVNLYGAKGSWQSTGQGEDYFLQF